MKNKDEFIKKITDLKGRSKLDLSADEDLSIAVMNLVSIEEHFFFTAKKTEKSKYFDLLRETREMRKELLSKLVRGYEGEVWCISKHLLAASMRLFEVGTKLLGQGKKKDAEDLFEKSYKLYTLFWGINLKQIDLGDVSKIDKNELSKEVKPKSGVFSKLKEIVKKAVDCCIE